MEIELNILSSPRIFLVRMLVFLVLCALVAVVLYKQIVLAFFANPGLNALIGIVLLIGIILAFRQVIRLYPEVSWVNNFRVADPGLAMDRHPTLLAPMAAILGGGGERTGRITISQQTMRHLLDSIATRLDEARDISRYMTGLLVFLGLLGTFWGLIETVGSVGKVIDGLKVGGDAGALFDTLKEGLAAPLGDTVQGTIDNPFCHRLLALVHQAVHKLSKDGVSEFGIRQDLAFDRGATARHVRRSYCGRFAPYFERRCRRSFTPWVSRVPRMM